MKKPSRVLIVHGGEYHDFDGFTAYCIARLRPSLYALSAVAYDGMADMLSADRFDCVIMYTCVPGVAGAENRGCIDEKQSSALCSWVETGGGLLALHGAPVSAQGNAALRRLMGGEFISHPPQCEFQVMPLYRPHPLTAGVGAFTVRDELYIEDYDAGLDIHLVSVHNGTAYPSAWSRSHGSGSVVRIALGHDSGAWNHPSFCLLLDNAVGWLCDREKGMKK